MVNWKERLEGVRRWIDGEEIDLSPRIQAAADMKSESERFLQKLRDAIEDILRNEITRIPNANKAYVPEKFVVFLSEESGKTLSDDKRRFFEQGLSALLLEAAKDMAGSLELTAKKINVSISVNGNLKGDDIEVRAMSENVQKTIESVQAESEAATIRMPEPVRQKGTIIDKGTIRDDDFGILYRVEVWRSGKKLDDIPVILRKNTIGREDDEKVANLRLPTDNLKISRIHAEITLDEEGDLWVTALHHNPTKVGNTVIRSGERTRLGLDREIHIYDFLLKVVYPE